MGLQQHLGAGEVSTVSSVWIRSCQLPSPWTNPLTGTCWIFEVTLFVPEATVVVAVAVNSC